MAKQRKDAKGYRCTTGGCINCHKNTSTSREIAFHAGGVAKCVHGVLTYCTSCGQIFVSLFNAAALFASGRRKRRQ